MEQHSLDTKYHIFYQNLKDFAIKTNLAAPSNIEGAAESEIMDFEKRHNLFFPLAFRVYLKYFGRNATIKNIDSLPYTLGQLEFKMKDVYRLDLKLVVQKKGYLNDVDSSHNDILVPLTNIISIKDTIFIWWEDTTPMWTFIDSSVENPIIFDLMYYSGERSFDDCTIETEFYTLTSFIRDRFFAAIQIKFYDTDYSSYTRENDQYRYELGLKLSSIDLTNIAWAKVYTKIYKTKPFHHTTFMRHRCAFCRIIEEKEQQEDRILTIDEFEWAFIAYLKEQGYDV